MPEQRTLQGRVRGVVLAHTGAIAPYPFAQQVAESGVGLGEAPDLAIGLSQDDFQFTTATASAEVIDLVGAGADIS
ncbi:hypothetical protein D3C71_1954520 [compost metagenome]